MIKMLKHRWWMIIVAIVAVIGCAYYSGLFAKTVSHQQVKGAPEIGTPTFFFHGYGSSYHAEEYMVNGAIKEGILSKKDVIVAHVSASGAVKLDGKFAAHTKHPVVEVNYANPRNSNYHTDGRWARNVIVTVQNHYRFKKINLVGHSMGNQDIAYYLLDNSRDKKLPILNKEVALAAPFNGLVMSDHNKNHDKINANGKPKRFNQSYDELRELRRTYPKTAEVLNIYGNTGHGTDGDLTIQSAQSMKYLVSGRAKSYREVEIKGKQASHGRLHHNDDVNQLLYNFLWNHAV